MLHTAGTTTPRITAIDEAGAYCVLELASGVEVFATLEEVENMTRQGMEWSERQGAAA